MDVAVSTDGGTTYLANTLISALNPGDIWTKYELPLAAFRGQTVKIVFIGRPGTNQDSPRYYLDNVQIETAPPCQAAVSPYITGLTSTGVNVNWTLRGTGFGSVPDSFNIDVLAAGTVVQSQVMAMPSAVTYSHALTGLVPGTAYTVRVTSNCTASYDGLGTQAEVSFSTPVAPLSLPYNQDFDTLTALPAGANGRNAYFNTQASLCYGGVGASVRMVATATEFASLILPPLDVEADSYEMEVRLMRTSGPDAQYSLGYLTDPSDISNMVPLFIDRLTEANRWTSVRYNTAAAGDRSRPVYPCIVLMAGEGVSLYVDNVRLHAIPACTRPEQVRVSGVSDTAATFSWAATNAGTVRILRYSADTTLLATYTTTGSGYTVTGLQPENDYLFALRGICSAADSSDLTDFIPVRTEAVFVCPEVYTIAVNITESSAEVLGEQDVTEMLVAYGPAGTPRDSCTTVHAYSRTAAIAGLEPGTDYCYYVARVCADGSTSAWSEARAFRTLAHICPLPQLTVNNITTASATIRRSGAGSYEVVVDSLVFDTASIPAAPMLRTVIADTVALAGLEQNTHYYYSARTICAAGDTSAWTAVTSFVTMERCHSITATVSSITDESCVITPTAIAATWQVAYGTAGTPIAQMTVATASGASDTITGLDAVTTYEYAVRAICGPSDTSAWSTVGSFITKPAPVIPPYTTGWEDAADNLGWTFYSNNQTNSYCIGGAASAIKSGSGALYVSNGSAAHAYANNTTTHCFAYRPVSFGEGSYQVDFAWRCEGGEGGETYAYDFARVMLIPEAIDPTTVTGRTSADGLIQLGGNPDLAGCMTETSGWQAASELLDMTSRSGLYNLVFYWTNDGSAGTNPPAAFDDLSITRISCVKPTAEALYVGADRATIVCHHGIAGQYEIIVDSQAINEAELPEAPLARRIIQGSSSVVTGLSANTQYYYIARAICQEGDTSLWCAPLSFYTHCDPYATPYAEGFEAAGSENCWYTLTAGRLPVRAQTYHSGQGSLMLDGINAASPEFIVDSLADHMITGWARSTADSATFQIGVMVDPNDLSTYELLTTVRLGAANRWNEFTTYFTALNSPDYADLGTARHIVLATNGQTVYFDDIVVAPTPACAKPTDAVATAITDSSFTLTFTENGTATAWIVAVNGQERTITSNPAVIAGLAPQTTYTVSVAALCGPGDTSLFSTVGNITTGCVTAQLPYHESFESLPTSISDATVNMINSICWEQINTFQYQGGYPKYYADGSGVTDGAKSLKLTNKRGMSLYLILPRLAPSPSYKVSFSNKYESATNSGNLDLGYFTDPADTTTFVVLYNAEKSTTELVNHETVVTPPAGARLAFRYGPTPPNTSSSWYDWLDNVLVEEIRSCTAPNAPEVTAVTATTADIQFVDGASTHSLWEYVVVEAGGSFNAITPVRTDTTSFTVSGLEGSSSYDLYLRAVCAEGDESAWKKCAIQTACNPTIITVAQPLVENFDGTVPALCWSQANFGPAQRSAMQSDSHSASGIYSVNFPDAQDGTRTALISPPIALSSTHGYRVHLKVLRRSTSYQRYTTEGFHVLLSEDADLNAANIGSKLDLGFVATDFRNAPAVDADGWYDYTFDIPFTEQGVRYVMITYFNCYGSSGYADDFSVEEIAACPEPDVAATVSTTMTTITADVPMNQRAEAQIGWQAGSVDEPTDIAGTVTTTDGNAVITGLTAETTYSVFYRYICAVGDTSAWSPAAVATTKVSDCFAPENIHEEGVTNYHHVALVWTRVPDATAFEYRLISDSTVAEAGTVAENRYENDSLQANTPYVLRVRTLCPADTSDWQDYSFSTTIVANELPFICDFEDTVFNHTWQMDRFDGPNGFTIETGGAYSGSYGLFVANYGTAPSYYTGMTSSSAASAAIIFGRGIYSVSFDWRCNGESCCDYGTVYLMPYGSTVQGTPTADAITLIDKAKGQANWTQFNGTATITTPGVYCLVIGWTNDSGSGENPPMNVDNIVIVDQSCAMPQVKVTAFADTTATVLITRTNATDRIEWGITTGETESDVTVWTQDSTVSRNITMQLTGLTPRTQYRLFARRICYGNTLSDNRVVSFTTLSRILAVPYATGFEPEEDNAVWNTVATGNYFVIGSGAQASGLQSIYITNDGATNGYTTNEYGASVRTDAYAYASFSLLPNTTYTVNYDWRAVGEAVSDYGHIFALPAETPITGTSMVSLDYRNVPAGAIRLDQGTVCEQSSWTRYRADFTVAAAGNYNVVFYWRNDAAFGSNPPLAVDNFSITRAITGADVYDTICFNSGYFQHGVNMPAGRMQPGDTVIFNARCLGATYNDPDTVCNVHLHMYPMFENAIYDTICAGQAYQGHGFSIAQPQSRTYTIDEPLPNGCISSNTLYLTVIEAVQHTTDTICAGSSYLFGDQALTTSGLYVRQYLSSRGCTVTDSLTLCVLPDTIAETQTICRALVPYEWNGRQLSQSGIYSATVTGPRGCDITHVLTLTVLGGDSTINVAFCQGGQAFVVDTVITTAGTYTLTRVTAEGCDLTYHITATQTAPVPAEVHDVACEGRPYSGYGINGLDVTADTVVTITSRTADALCDSVTVVYIAYRPAQSSEFSDTITEGDTYDWNDNTYTTAGDYTATFQDQYGCDSVVTLHLVVKTGVDNAMAAEALIRVVPNPAHAGQATLVFVSGTGPIARVEVINSFGAIISAWEPVSTPIDLTAPATAGVYHVRVITTDGRVAIAKLIVQ